MLHYYKWEIIQEQVHIDVGYIFNLGYCFTNNTFSFNLLK